jgi:hypothetical protein
MYKYIVAFMLVTPLIGIWLVEGGEYSGSVGIVGYPNGATVAFALYAVGVALIAVACSGRKHRLPEVHVPVEEANAMFRRFSTSLLIFEIAWLLFFLFGFGAINVWLAIVPKQEFRTGLGAFGYIPNAMSKFIIPALVAYAALLYMRTAKTRWMTMRLVAICAIAFINGGSWGFKATAISSVMPALLLLNWRVRPLALVALGAFFVSSVVAFFLLFDVNFEDGADMQTYLLRRLTVLQGDSVWYIWDLYITNQPLPSYWPTLLAAIGDKMLTVLGLSRADTYTWMLYHYDWMITYLTGSSLESIAGGHSITATPFAEGLLAGGIPGVVLFTVIAGVLTGRMYRFLDRALRQGRTVAAALGATYFFYFLAPWLNAGTIVQLFHISLLISFSITLVVLYFMRRIRLSPARAVAVRPIAPAAPAS